MYEALGHAHYRPVRALRRLSALLQVLAGDGGLAVERLGCLRDGRAVEFCRSCFRGDLYDFAGAKPRAVPSRRGRGRAENQ